jgi:hypothetical protein
LKQSVVEQEKIHLSLLNFTATIKEYYPGKMALEVLCTIYGPNIASDKIQVIAQILSVQSLLVAGPILP